MDGFTGFKTATTQELPEAVAVMDPFHAWPATRWTSAADGSNRTPVGTAAAKATRSMPIGGPCTPVPVCSPTSSNSAWVAVRHRRSCRGELRDLPAHDRCLPRIRPRPGQSGDDRRDRGSGCRRSNRTDRVTQARTDAEAARRRRPAYVDRPGTSNAPTEAFIILGPSRGVTDVADGADRVRERHVLWSMSLTRTGWIWLSLLAFPRPGRCQRVRRGDVPDATVQVTPRFLARAPDNLQRTSGTPARLRPRVPQPHQLHRQIPTRSRRLQAPTTPPIVKSSLSAIGTMPVPAMRVANGIRQSARAHTPACWCRAATEGLT